ncbi:uncharacterized protein LOC126371336 [Pectinophora gossypiella]|uniref:uncharacterized protein LOC126371336 n=1 Tax=Pectinophora gossypiella TaxID=13191 RepID=UPI00214E3656|nr:uncharacterized protein LOC126371336 [Pectinophora gossypiella]
MTNFGEIVEPVTRTAWEDWDEVTPERSFPELKWQKDLESPGDIDTIFILEGKYLADCIKMQSSNLELVNTIPEVSLQLYKSRTVNKYICTIKDYNVVLSSEIVELLRQYLIVSVNVIAIQTKPLSDYQAMELSGQDCIIRAVSTTKRIQLNLKYPKLEQPNIVSGVSAGVISLREHLNEAGLALLCYMEHPEEFQIEEMEKLLDKLNISQNSNARPSSVLNSNLYI